MLPMEARSPPLRLLGEATYLIKDDVSAHIHGVGFTTV